MAVNRRDHEWNEAVAAWEVALAIYKMRLAYGRIDQDYRKAGRQARKALRRCFNLAHEQRRIWSPGECRTFY